MALFAHTPTPKEILVERVGFLRFAEAQGWFDDTVVQLNDYATKAQGGSGLTIAEGTPQSVACSASHSQTYYSYCSCSGQLRVKIDGR